MLGNKNRSPLANVAVIFFQGSMLSMHGIGGRAARIAFSFDKQGRVRDFGSQENLSVQGLLMRAFRQGPSSYHDSKSMESVPSHFILSSL